MKDDISSDAPLESNVEFAQVQARQQGASAAAQKAFPLPLLGFVASLNGQGGGIVLGAGSVPTGITVSFSNGAGTISFNLSGLADIATKKSNLAAIVDPAVGNDSSQGYAAGSFWLNTITPSFWVAVSVGVGAAVWLQLG